MDKISKNRILLFMFCLFIFVSIGISAPALAATLVDYPIDCHGQMVSQQSSIPVNIDGYISDAEWGDAAPGCLINFVNDDVPTETLAGRLLFKHDADNLYILLIVDSVMGSNCTAEFHFDNDNSGAFKQYSDGLMWTNHYGIEQHYDRYYDAGSGPGWTDDANNDVFAARLIYPGELQNYTVYEFSHPLHDNDLEDFNLFPPATVGFDINYGFDGIEVGQHYNYHYPDIYSYNHLAQLVIGASAPVITPPIVTTMPATKITTTGATFNGTINPNGYPTTYFFEYKETSDSYWLQTATTNYEDSGTPPGKVTLPVIFEPIPIIDTTYHYRIVASNTTDIFSRGDDQTFTIYLTDSDGDHIADAYDNCRYVSNENQDLPEDGGLIGTACGGDLIKNEIALPTSTFEPGVPFWVQATITNNTGQDIQTIKPDCYNTRWIIPGANPLCRRGPSYGIPRDLIIIPSGGSYTIKCDINEMFESVPTGAAQIAAVYENYIVDPDWKMNPGGCTVDNDCYVIWAGSVLSGVETISIPDTLPKTLVTADVSFNPDQWEAAWAYSNSPPITARISNFLSSDVYNNASFDVEQINRSSIMLNGANVPIISFTPDLISNSLYVQFDRALAVQSLGSSIQPGLSYPATVQGMIGNDVFSGKQNIGIVENTGTLLVKADLHTVGSGSKPASKKEPIVGMTVRLYDKSTGSCAAGYGISWQNYSDIYNDPSCPPVSKPCTDTEGMARFNPPPGNYLVIGDYEIKNVNGDIDHIYIGNSVGQIPAGVETNKYLQVIKKADGKKVPAKYSMFTGSQLLVIAPEYVEWSERSELYPFVFDSLGDWTVTTSVAPPEGFVADNDALSAEVNSNVEAVQFTITDIGSKWVGTKVKHKIKHKGQKEKTFETEVGIKLSPELAAKKGLSIYGEVDPKKNKTNK